MIVIRATEQTKAEKGAMAWGGQGSRDPASSYQQSSFSQDNEV